MNKLTEDLILTENCLRKAKERGISIRQVFEAITSGRPWMSELGGLSFFHNGIEVITCSSFEYVLTVIDHGQDLSHQSVSSEIFVPQLNFHSDEVQKSSYAYVR